VTPKLMLEAMTLLLVLFASLGCLNLYIIWQMWLMSLSPKPPE